MKSIRAMILVGLVISFGGIIAKTPEEHSHELGVIVKVFGKAFDQELNSIDTEQTKDTKQNFNEVEQYITQNINSITAKLYHIITHELTEAQQTYMLNLLKDLHALSSTTLEELMLMADACSTYAKRREGNKLLEIYAPKLAQKIKNRSECNRAQILELTRELETVDVHDTPQNLLTRFMCKCCYVYDLALMERIDIGTCQSALHLQRCLRYYINDQIAFPFVVFNDFYFAPGWKKEFKQSAHMFHIINMITGAVLLQLDNTH